MTLAALTSPPTKNNQPTKISMANEELFGNVAARIPRITIAMPVTLGGTTMALAGCGNTSIESGAELVESYVQPEDFVVPGVGVYYASTCAARC